MKRFVSLLALLLTAALLFSGCIPLLSVVVDVLDDEIPVEKKRASDDSVLTDSGEGFVYDSLSSLLDEYSLEEDFSEETLQMLRKSLALAEEEETSDPEARLALRHFDDMPYEAPNVEAFSDAVDAVEELLDRNADAELVAAYVDLCNEAYASFYTNYNIAMVRYSMDVTDPAAKAAYDECELASVEIERLYNDMYDLCAYASIWEELETLCFEAGELYAYANEECNYTDEEYDRYYELLGEEAMLLTEYRSVSSDPTVTVDGVTYHYYEALNDPDLDWDTYDAVCSAYYEKYNPLLGDIYIELIGVRNEMAACLGYDSYEEYAFDFEYGRDYSPEDANALVADIKTYIAPLYRKALEGEAWYWLWDPAVSEEELGATADAFTAELGGSTAETWELLNAYGLCDYRIAYEKEMTSYQTYFFDYAVPFTFVYSTGYQSDILTLIHELGHAVDSNVNHEATVSLDLAEVFSQALEYILICRLDNEDLRAYKMLDTLDTYAQQGSYHEFERQVYALSESERTVERINEISLQTAIDFGYFEEGAEDLYLQNWIDIPHFFDLPFYVISYCVSNDAAFQIYALEAAQEGSGLSQFERLLPREYDGLLATLNAQSELASPFAEGRMEETAQVLDAYLEAYLSNLW